MSIVSLIIAPHIAVGPAEGTAKVETVKEVKIASPVKTVATENNILRLK